MPSTPLAYLITFRTYGTWLHGDARGSTDQLRNHFATPHLPPSPTLEARRIKALEHSPVILGPTERGIVESTVRSVCQHRGWQLYAVAARTNHVHTVLSADQAPERVLVDLKAWSTRRLREQGLIAGVSEVWAHHGSTVHLWHPESVDAAYHYVLYEQ